MNQDSKEFIQALENHNLDQIKKIPKSDLHNHFVLGGSRSYILEKTGYEILPFEGVLSTMQDMHDWNNRNLGKRFESEKMRRILIEAAFAQAKEDGVAVLEIGEDVWGLYEFFSGDVDLLLDAFMGAKMSIAPDVELKLQIGLSRHCPIDYLMKCLEPFWGRREFYSLDLSGDEMAQPILNFVPVYRRAREEGLRLKAHVGEWGTAEDVKTAVKLLELDEVQHGIRAAESEEVMDFLAERGIRLNITPTSNLKLGRVKDMEEHPIQRLYRHGIDVTINSDDVLIFDSDVSKEYLRLYENRVLTAKELDDIRLNGLNGV